MLRQFAESGACPMLFDVLWAPLFLVVLFLVHPLLGVVGACQCAFSCFGLAFAGECPHRSLRLARSALRCRGVTARFVIAVGNIHVIRTMGMLDGAARLIYQAAQDARTRTTWPSAATRSSC